MATTDAKNAVRCIACKHAEFMRWNENPIIAYCKFYKERFVAECDRQCKCFVASGNLHPDITVFDHYEADDDF